MLVRSDSLGALAFVGGRANGRKAATTLADTGKRHILEQEGLNAWGIWDFSDWDGLAAHLTKGFEYAKQRCTAYPRYVVQRELFDQFLQTYLPVVQSLRFGHPLAVESARRRAAGPALRPGHPRHQGRRPARAPRRGDPGRRPAAVPRLAVRRAASSTGRTPAPTWRRPAC